ncbi:MAG: NADPH-dependent glutamate synthase [bacterium]|nr:NADPH-dependent glutamate synthase [bacterium]
MAAKEKIPRQAMPEQEPLVRARNFLEVPFGYTAELAIAEASRCIQCKNPKCVAGCPVGIDIPAFLKMITQGEFAASARKIKEMNALPAICGRVCPQEEQCEKVCVVGIKQEPVAIGRLERFAADFERINELVTIPERAPATGKRIAVVGSGPAGLTVAGDLALLGHDVTVFEALHKAGGVLIYGIPEFRLPKSIVQSEVNYLEQLGVKFVFNSVIGRTLTVYELLEEEKFDSVFLGTGAGLPYFMNIPGENFNGVYSANEFLTRSNLMRAFDFPNSDTPIMKAKRVAVLGGGNVAMDAARTAIRLGAEKVSVVYRRSRNEMPARIEEIHHAEEEGIEFRFLTNPIELLGDDQGWVRGMKMVKMELGEPDASGRRRPVVIEGSEYESEFDCVVVSIGNGSNPLIPQTTPGLNTNKWGNIIATDDGATSIPGVYAGGDVVIGAATVILAMGAARKASAAMHQYMIEKEV